MQYSSQISQSYKKNPNCNLQQRGSVNYKDDNFYNVDKKVRINNNLISLTAESTIL